MKPSEKLELERERLKLMYSHEEELYAKGYTHVLGVDEVGRGPLCGPVMTACCVLRPGEEILYLNDSKKLSEKRREALAPEIREKAVCYAFGSASPEEIDRLNILEATKMAMREAVKGCIDKLSDTYEGELRPYVLVDGNREIEGLACPQSCIVKGDSFSASIAAASIIAKVERDHMMIGYDSIYPGYGFAKNKGYGTKEHLLALKRLGPTPIHRQSFVPKSKTAVGRKYEELAAKLLKLNGYELIERNFRGRHGEIDLIAKDGETLCFIEVKFRSDESHGLPSEAVDKKKRGRIYKTSEEYILKLRERPKLSFKGLRFDIVEIEKDRYRILKDAFSAHDINGRVSYF